MRKLGIVLAGAGALWLLATDAGRRRARMLSGRASGLVRRLGPAKDYDDGTLKAKVESELFRDADLPKGQVSVNAQHGVVQLRGEVESPELIDELVARTRSVGGVREVENLLHVPGTPAPMHQ